MVIAIPDGRSVVEAERSVDALASSASMIPVKLRCPRCGKNVEGFSCRQCSCEMKLKNGIVHALPPERAARYTTFMEDYARIRAAEGRGSDTEDFYLSLPFVDRSGRNSHQWAIRAKSYHHLIQHVLEPQHDNGTVLDIGSGNCWLSYRLALQNYSPVAVDLLTNEQDGLGAAIHYETALGMSIPRFQAEATHLPFQDRQFDVILFNASFHYAESYEITLREALRCLKQEGLIVIMDTPWYSRDESGRQMVRERQENFRRRFGTASDSVQSLEYLTDARLHDLESSLPIYFTTHSPWYGWKWAMRPVRAMMQRKREPSRFRIYVGRKHV